MAGRVEYSRKETRQVKFRCNDCSRVFLADAEVTITKYMMKSKPKISTERAWCACGSYNTSKAKKRAACGRQFTLDEWTRRK